MGQFPALEQVSQIVNSNLSLEGSHNMQTALKSIDTATANALSFISKALDIVDLADKTVDETENCDQILRAMETPAELASKAAYALDVPGKTLPQESKALELTALLEAMTVMGSNWNSVQGVKLYVPGLTTLAKRLIVELQDELA